MDPLFDANPIDLQHRATPKKLEVEDSSSVIALAHAKMRQAGKEPKLTPEEAETALKQYYSLFALSDDCTFAVSSEVDEYWYWHILDTQAYQSMCERVLGFVAHHVPLMPGDELACEEVREVYRKSREILVRHYGDDINPRAYPPLSGDARDKDIVYVCQWTTGRTVSAPAFNTMKHVVFKIKPGKKSVWQAWGDYLHEHEAEVLATMEQENCMFERSIIFERESELFMIGSIQFNGQPKKADMTIELNQKHAAIKNECLIGIATFEGNYNVPDQYETVYEFDRRSK